MSFDWNDYLKLAESLQSHPDKPGPKEASLRSATSRAYYAAFKSAVNFARKEGFEPRYTGEDHWSIKRHFQYYHADHSDIRSKIAVELGRMYDNRRMADYFNELKRTSPIVLSELTIKMAQSVLAKLEFLRKS